MSKFNEINYQYCKFCNKECKSLNSLKQHEIRCKKNPNRIRCGFDKNSVSEEERKLWRKKIGSPTKNKVCINFFQKNKFVNKNEVQFYLDRGWKLGRFLSEAEIFKLVSRKGKASTEEKEKIRREKISATMKEKHCGGKRKNSGIGKKSFYKGIYCDSSWELAYVIWMTDHNKFIQRCEERRRYTYNGEKHFYYPDFVTDEGIIEIKGYNSEIWQAKLKENSDIKVLYESEMIPYLEYAKQKYGKDFALKFKIKK